jgi:hypothetical protein
MQQSRLRPPVQLFSNSLTRSVVLLGETVLLAQWYIKMFTERNTTVTRRMVSSVMLRRVALVSTDVSEGT